MQLASWRIKAFNLAPHEARRAVRDYCAAVALPEETISDALLCVSEAVTNVVLHAYRDCNESAIVDLEAWCDPQLCILVRDGGVGLRPRTDSVGLGLGLPIMSRLTESIEVRTPRGGGTEVLMRFAPAPQNGS